MPAGTFFPSRLATKHPESYEPGTAKVAECAKKLLCLHEGPVIGMILVSFVAAKGYVWADIWENLAGS